LPGILFILGFIQVLWVGIVEGIGLSEVHDVTLGKTLLLTVGLGLLGFLVA
jgi:hypothetical protein